ncbi:MAG: TonB-dependent receptor [Sphingopyxis sp.]|nr:TonB-dependent receptor [Sphingopyxis sp.]
MKSCTTISVSKRALSGLLLGTSLVAATAVQAQDGNTITDNRTDEAQQDDGSVFSQEITVTATRRSESVNNVGISITALGGEQLANLRINEPEKLALVTPGVTIAKAAGSAVSVITIRGSGNSDFAAHHETPSAVYFDGIYAGAATGGSFPAFDLERVEVLRGPQGTLFGRNATGGLVHFISRQPTQHFEAGGEIGYGRFDQLRAEAYISGALSEAVSARLSGFYIRDDGNVENQSGGARLGAQDRLAGRFQLLIEPGSDTEVRLIARGFRERSRDGVYDPLPSYVDANGVSQFVPADGDIHGTGAGKDFYGYREADDNPWTASPNLIGRMNKDIYAFTGSINHDFGGAKLSSLTDYTKVKSYYLEDTDSTPFAQAFYDASENSGQWSQELRLNDDDGAFRWVGGIYLLKLDGLYNTRFSLPTLANLFDPEAFPDPLSSATPTSVYEVRTKTAAVFFQAEQDLSEQLTLIAGIRWTWDKRKLDLFGSCVETAEGACAFDGFLTSPDIISAIGGADNMIHLGQKSDDWSGRIELDWKVAPGMLIYASASKGLKGGGFTVPLDGLLRPDQLPYRPENLYAYELGFKARVIPELRINGSAFYYDYRNFQTFLFSGLTSVILNKQGNFKGGELEVVATPGDGVDLLGGVSYLDARVEDVATPNGVMDQRPINSPKWKLNWLARKAFDLGEYTLAVQYDGNYSSSRYYNVVNSPVVRAGSYALHNASISLAPSSDRWKLSAYVENIGNTANINSIFDLSTLGYTIRKFGRQRTFGLSLAAKY